MYYKIDPQYTSFILTSIPFSTTNNTSFQKWIYYKIDPPYAIFILASIFFDLLI